MSEQIKTVAGRDLKVGDVLKVWWKPGRDTVTKIEPYRGPLESMFQKESEGASIAYFAIWRLSMTVPHNEAYECIRAETPLGFIEIERH